MFPETQRQIKCVRNVLGNKKRTKVYLDYDELLEKQEENNTDTVIQK